MDNNLQIEKYTNGEMTLAERTAFEASMANDSALRNDVNLNKKLIKSLQFRRLENQISEAHEANLVLLKKRTYVKIGLFLAGITLFSCLIWHFWPKPTNISPAPAPVPPTEIPKIEPQITPILIPKIEPKKPKIEEQKPVEIQKINRGIAQISPEESLKSDTKIRTRGLESEALPDQFLSNLDNLLKNYPPILPPAEGDLIPIQNDIKSDNYLAALAKIEALKSTSANFGNLQYLHGICLLATEDFAKATEKFVLNTANQDNSLKEEARFWMAISYLGRNERNNAALLLKNISKTSTTSRKSLADSILVDYKLDSK
jgi:hypothetical protein